MTGVGNNGLYLSLKKSCPLSRQYTEWRDCGKTYQFSVHSFQDVSIKKYLDNLKL